MDKKLILDWMVQEAESKAQKHYRECYRRTRRLASLDHDLCWLNKDKEISLPGRLPKDPSKMIPVLKKHFKNKRNKISFISLVLHHYFPEEYFFYRPSQLEEEIFTGLGFLSDVVPEFDLPFSRVGGTNFRNYLRLNEALISFARGRWPSPKDWQDRLMYFLYEGLGRPFVEKGYHPPYWLMVTGPEFFGSLDNNKSLDWSGAKEMQVGDTVFMYRKLPRAAITDIFRVATEPRFIPWDGWDGFDVDIDKLCSLRKDIPFSQLKADDVIGNWGVVKKALVGTVAVPMPPRVSNSLLGIIPKTVREKYRLRCEHVPPPPPAGSQQPPFPQPTLATPQYTGNFALEADFEKQVIAPLLKRWGFGPKPQYGFRYRTSSDYHIGLVDFLVSDQGEPLTLFEDKLRIVNDEELQPCVDQAKTYALLLALPSFVVASPQGMWLYALDGDQERLIKPITTAGTHKQQEDEFKSLLQQQRK